MSEASVEIFEAMTSNVGRKAYTVRVTGADGQPIAGAEVTMRIQGDGSFDSGFDSKETKHDTDASGETHIEWHRRSIFLRNVKAQLQAECGVDGANLTLEETQPKVATTSYDISGQHKWTEIGRI